MVILNKLVVVVVVLRTPPYYGQFSLSLGKVHTLS